MSNRYYDGPVSDHFDGTRFFHAGLASTDKSLFDLLRWRLFGSRSRWPKRVDARSGIRPDSRVAGLRVTLVGHASYLLQVDGRNVLLDPVWSERASPFTFAGPRRHNPPAIALDDLPPIDLVLITHNHYDHLDLATLARLWKRHRPRVVAPLGNDTTIRHAMPEAVVETGDWWDAFEVGDDLRVTIVPSYHWSSRSLGDRRMALWGGFVVEGLSGVAYCPGDTAYRDGAIFREIGRRFPRIDVAMLPIGAYAPRWFMDTQHTDPSEAVMIASDCGTRQALGVHWGTFALTDEPFDEPAAELAEALRRTSLDGIRFDAMRPGDVWTAR